MRRILRRGGSFEAADRIGAGQQAIEEDPTLTSPEVRYLVNFIRESKRGVILRKPTRRLAEELVADE